MLLDDTGFGQLGCYGSDIDTSDIDTSDIDTSDIDTSDIDTSDIDTSDIDTSDIDTSDIDALAANGLRFTSFHVTPRCSPTRASLLTGRSQHAVGMRAVSNFLTCFDNQLGHISNRAATVAEVLREAGSATFCVGKWQLAPMEQCSAAGPFDQWPLARGFHHFYGLLEGETDQWSSSPRSMSPRAPRPRWSASGAATACRAPRRSRSTASRPGLPGSRCSSA